MKKIKKFFSDFKAFISRGNVLDMAVGVIVASAFTAIVTALTNGIIMPLVNWIIAVTCGGGIESAYTILVPAYSDDAKTILDLSNSIYIDWGALISAILDFIIIAFVLFSLLRLFMNASKGLKKAKGEYPTRQERKILKAEGVNMKDHKALIAATAELRKRNEKAPEPAKPTQEQLLTEILVELKKQNASEEVAAEAEKAVEVEK